MTSRSRSLKKYSSLPKKNESIVLIEGQSGIDFTWTKLAKEYKGSPLYKIEFENQEEKTCVNIVDDRNKYLVFQNKDGNYVLFHIEGLPVEEKMRTLCLQKLLGRSKTLKKLPKNELLVKNIVLLQHCSPDFDLTDAQQILGGLNEILQRKCGDLFLKFAPFYEFTEPLTRFNEHSYLCIGGNFYETFILALCRSTPEATCISTIELLLRPAGEIAILSRTIPAEEGKKYNKMLRFVLMMIATHIPGIHSIRSVAIHPVSAWLLWKYFHARVDDEDPFHNFLRNKNVVPENLTMELLQQYISEKKQPIHLTVDISEKNASSSYEEFQKLVSLDDGIRC
jgi:hypothetical protein